ncbi:MAG: SufD family Fe-S cluster assembly protein [Candidatus Cryptobacteroides sp.]
MTGCKDTNRQDCIRVPEDGTFRKVIVLGGGTAAEGGPQTGGRAVEGLCALPERIVLERGASADIVLIVLPGTGCDIPLEVRLAGEGARADISGIYVCGADERVRIAADVIHEVPRCTSRQLFKGIAAGKSRVDFYGKIVVAQDAQKTEAYQENHNILLTDDALVNTKPQLEIYADDVKCSHGATVGRLNEEEQFYMRSRGIPEQEARALQMISFIAPVLEAVKDDARRETLLGMAEDAIRKIL